MRVLNIKKENTNTDINARFLFESEEESVNSPLSFKKASPLSISKLNKGFVKLNKLSKINPALAKSHTSEYEKNIRTTYKRLTGKEIPDGTDIAQLVKEIEETGKDVGDLNLDDFKIVQSGEKTFAGFRKGVPKVFSDIANYAKKFSDNVLKPRTMAIVNIANINKNQLKKSELKLPLKAFIFKPDQTKFKVNKQTRFVIGYDSDFPKNKEVVVFIQERDKKFIKRISIDTIDKIIQLSNIIWGFFVGGIHLAEQKLITFLEKEKGVFIELANNLSKNGEFKPEKIDEKKLIILPILGELKQFLFEFLHTSEEGTKIGIFSKFNKKMFNITHRFNNGEVLTDEYIISKEFHNEFIKYTHKIADNTPTQFIGGNTEDTYYKKLRGKIGYKALKLVFDKAVDTIKGNNKNNLKIVSVVGRYKTTKFDKTHNYEAEIIMLKSDKYEYLTITQLYLLVEGGSKRKTKDGSRNLNTRVRKIMIDYKDNKGNEHRSVVSPKLIDIQQVLELF